MYHLLPLLLTYFSLPLYIALKEINLRLKLNSNFFCFSSRRLKYICVYFFLSPFPPPTVSCICGYFRVILFWINKHRPNMAWASVFLIERCRSFQLWFNFLKKTVSDPVLFCSGYCYVFLSFIPLRFLSLCVCMEQNKYVYLKILFKIW